MRSAVYREFVRSEINKVPQKERDKAKKFKEYEPGYLHIDDTYLPKIGGIKYYLFVAIDRIHDRYIIKYMTLKHPRI
jgi:transposase-like protein